MESFIEEAENEDQGIHFSSEEEDQVINEMYGKSNRDELKEDSAIQLRYDDWFAKPGTHRDSDKEGDPIENNIELEKTNLYYNSQSDIKKELSRFQKEQEEKLKEIQNEEKYILEEDDVELSKHQLKQQRMANRIKKLEEENLKSKSWSLSGESQANQRPINSLLEEELDYEFASKLPPLITEEVTKSIEEIIRYRIQEKAFDDVIQKEGVKEEVKKEEIKLDSNKSKRSLAEIYEEDFLMSTKSTSVKRDDKTKKEEEEIPEKWDKTQTTVLRFYKRIFDELDNMVGTENPTTKDK